METIGEEEEDLVTMEEPGGGREEPVLCGEQKTPCNSVKGRGRGLSKSSNTPSLTPSLITDYYSTKRVMMPGSDVLEEFTMDDSWEMLAASMMSETDTKSPVVEEGDHAPSVEGLAKVVEGGHEDIKYAVEDEYDHAPSSITSL